MTFLIKGLPCLGFAVKIIIFAQIWFYHIIMVAFLNIKEMELPTKNVKQILFMMAMFWQLNPTRPKNATFKATNASHELLHLLKGLLIW